MNNYAQRNHGSEKEIRAVEEKKAGTLYVLNNDLKAILNLARLPARLNTGQTAACLGFKPHDIPVLAARGFLKPLGRPVQNSDKYYARSRILDVADDEEWLSRATAALSQHWHDKNSRKFKPTIAVNQH
jgi:hypothetical protein